MDQHTPHLPSKSRATSHPPHPPRPSPLPAGRLLSGPGLVGGSEPGLAEPHGRLRWRPTLVIHQRNRGPSCRPRCPRTQPSWATLLPPWDHHFGPRSSSGPTPPAACTRLSSAADLPHTPPTTWPTHSGGLPGPRDGPADPNRSSSRGYTTRGLSGRPCDHPPTQTTAARGMSPEGPHYSQDLTLFGGGPPRVLTPWGQVCGVSGLWGPG